MATAAPFVAVAVDAVFVVVAEPVVELTAVVVVCVVVCVVVAVVDVSSLPPDVRIRALERELGKFTDGNAPPPLAVTDPVASGSSVIEPYDENRSSQSRAVGIVTLVGVALKSDVKGCAKDAGKVALKSNLVRFSNAKQSSAGNTGV
jgi:hypothetical protein